MKFRKMNIYIVVFILVVTVILCIFPISFGRMPECKSENGLSERTTVSASDGFELSLILMSDDISNPVLIVCGGGPGIPEYLMEYLYPSVLPQEFTVCYWDYRGTGASYDPEVDPSQMDTDRFVEDTLTVTDYLRDRFNSDKIYIMGHSFGTYVALKTVERYPEKYCCYIAMSQIVDQRRSEIEAYDYMRDQYLQANDDSMVSEFDRFDIRNSEKDLISYCNSSLRDKAMHDLGVGTTRDMDNVITDIFFPSLRCPVYTQSERIGIWRGKILSKDFAEDKEIKSFCALTDIPKIDVPIIFITGRYDMTCCADLQEEYYSVIKAPYKQIFIFENSAHSPLYEETDEASRVIREIKNTVSCL